MKDWTKWLRLNETIAVCQYLLIPIFQATFSKRDLGRNLGVLLPSGTSNHVVYGTQQIDHLESFLIIVKKNIIEACHNVLCTNTYHPCFCRCKIMKKKREKQ